MNKNRSRKPKVDLTDDQKTKIECLLKDGCSVAKTSEMLETNKNCVYTFAKLIGWNTSWRDAKKYPNDRSGHISKLLISEKEIIARRDKGETLESIAKDAGCTREYIRVLEKRNGRIGKNIKIKKAREKYGPLLNLLNFKLKQMKREERQRTSHEERVRKDVENFYGAHLMWMNGDPTKDIIKFLGIKSGNFNWTVDKMRRRYGWFLPKRNRFGK